MEVRVPVMERNRVRKKDASASVMNGSKVLGKVGADGAAFPRSTGRLVTR